MISFVFCLLSFEQDIFSLLSFLSFEVLFVMITVERALFNAARNGDVEEVMSLLRDHPEINVNLECGNRYTALHIASLRGCHGAVKLLLSHPGINVNMKDKYGSTPLSFGCLRAHVSVVEVLLKDPRVDIRLGDYMGHTPLWQASCRGHCKVIEWLVASGRDLGENKKGKFGWNEKGYTALEIARKENETEAVTLLERFIDNPTQTRHEFRVKHGVLDALAAEVFALTVFLCDDLLRLKPALTDTTTASATQFFTIASKLPMELQMMLCHRVVGSRKQNILHKNSEAAFKSLAWILLSPSPVDPR